MESDHRCTSRIYFDNAGDNVTLTLYSHVREPLYSNSVVIAWWLHKIEYLAVNKGNILVNVSLVKIFIANLISITYKSSCVSAKQNFCGLSDRRYSTRVMPKCDFFLKKRMKEFFAYVELCLLSIKCKIPII